MKSVRAKLIASILICSLFTSVLIGVLVISNSARTAGKDAMTKMQLTGQKKAEEINSTIQKIEQSVDTLSEVAMSNFDYDSFRQSKDYADTYTETVQQAVLDFANHTNGAVTVYLRYNPNYSNPTSGIFAQRQSLDSDLQCLTPTDFSMYDESDVEHVGWYYLPVQAKEAIWMSPYMNENVNIYMISYVVPLFAEDGTSIGVVGMDIDFSQITDLVDETTVYQSGYAFLTDASGSIMHHKNVDEGTVITDLDSSLKKGADFLAEDGNQGKTLEYTYKNVDKKLAFYNLDNGMKLVLTAPVSEIYSEAYGLAKMIILAMIVAFILSAVIGIVMGTGLTKPIRQLTSVIEQTAALDFRPTEAGAKLRKQKDEIGDMATKIHDMRKKLRAMMENLQQTQQVLETNTGNLNQLMKQNSAYAEDNSAATQELAAGMEETSANAAHIVENVGIMRESSDNIQRLAEDGEKNSGQIQERAGEMERISTESRHKTDQMYAVMKQKTDAAVEQAKSVQKINALTDNIKQISSQTNLLALNANIEAARAGEAGRGFAVVASEIGDLATQTLDTVSTIDEIVGEVNSSVSNMTECLTTIMEFLEQTVLGDYEHFAQVGEQYHADAGTFQQIMQQTKEAVDALEQHIGEISSTVSEINSMVEQSTDGISGIAEKSGSTQNLVTEGYDKLQECTQSVNVIRDFVAQFHLD
jgi:methyl-accepting chemotaxis protein